MPRSHEIHTVFNKEIMKGLLHSFIIPTPLRHSKRGMVKEGNDVRFIRCHEILHQPIALFACVEAPLICIQADKVNTLVVEGVIAICTRIVWWSEAFLIIIPPLIMIATNRVVWNLLG